MFWEQNHLLPLYPTPLLIIYQFIKRIEDFSIRYDVFVDSVWISSLDTRQTRIVQQLHIFCLSFLVHSELLRPVYCVVDSDIDQHILHSNLLIS